MHVSSSLLLDSDIVIKEDAGESERDSEDEGEENAKNAPSPISTAPSTVNESSASFLELFDVKCDDAGAEMFAIASCCK